MVRSLLAAGVVVAACSAFVGCGGSSGETRTQSTRDSGGDPYVTAAQMRKIKIGMSAQRAFRDLGGKSPSGRHGKQGRPPLSYDYPILGSGKGDATDLGNAESWSWLEVCVANGHVTGKGRGRLGSARGWGQHAPGCPKEPSAPSV
jgi:hypothetical protein